MRVPIFSFLLSASVFSLLFPACTSRQLGDTTPTQSRNLASSDGASASRKSEGHQADRHYAGAPGDEGKTSSSEEDSEELSDGGDLSMDDSRPGALPPPQVIRKPHPLKKLSAEELEKLVRKDSEKLGTASLGKTNAGALYRPVMMESSDLWKVNNGNESYGTPETIKYLTHAITRVNEAYPGAPTISIGDISTANGGHFKPHLSHQAGRDVDLGFYYSDGSPWYAHANKDNLDLDRTWALVKFTITETDVEAIFLDRSLQTILREHATSLGENEEWLDQVFGGPSTNLRPMILHEPGHKSHLHIRYYNPIAQETGRRVYSALVKYKKIKPPTYFLKYTVKKGDSLIRIAKKHNTTVAVLKKANGLKNNRIYANRTFKIPKRGGVAQPPKLVLPARRVPSSFDSEDEFAGPSSSAPGSAGTAARAAL